MEQFHPDETNPFVPDEGSVGEFFARPQRRKSFSAAHWWIIASLWFMWTLVYMSVVVAHQRNDPERFKSLFLTPFFTAVAPLLGAMLRGFQDCCLQVSLSVLCWVLPIPMVAALLQWCWNPKHLILRIIRMLIWLIAWMLWFASGILPFGHALS